MPDFKDKERLDALRERLYERAPADGGPTTPRAGFSAGRAFDVARGWANITPAPVASPSVTPVAPIGVPITPEIVASSEKRRRSYRTYILLASIAVFVLALVGSSLYLIFGSNQISGRNISLTVAGPLAIAGGNVLTLGVTVDNQNPVAIEGATLIINYPSGTKSAGENPRDLFEERIQLEPIPSGTSRAIPVNAAIFGEENEEKTIEIAVDYRVTGSNGTFFKRAEPYKVTVNSSPLILRVESIEKVSAGQEFDVKLVVQSNAETPLSNVYVNATYPENFRIVRTEPAADYRDNGWTLKELAAKGTQSITIRGVASGLSEESFLIRFQAGTPRSDNQFIVGSVLAQTAATFTVEQPFVGVEVVVNGDRDGDAVIPSGGATEVTITVTNTHAVPVYDMNVRVAPTGSAFDESRLEVNHGFYDSVAKTLRWEVSGSPELAKVLPGEEREFRFKLGSDRDARTATLDLDTTVYARRVSESSVAEELIGAAKASVRYSSMVSVERQIDHLAGPLPPQVNKETLYTLTLAATAGANDLSGAVLTASLPQYIRWVNTYEGPGKVEFNPVNKELRWLIGEMKGREQAMLTFQVAFTPGLLQVGTTPVMMNRQEFTATDRFTGAPLRAEASPITAELSGEAGFDSKSGIVVGEEGSE